MLRSFIRISVLLLFLSCLRLGAQTNLNGVPIITNYPYDITGGTEQNWCITQDLRGILYVGNHEKGILEYDGVEWRVIPVKNDAQVISLVTGDNGVVYVGLAGDFGRLEPDSCGNLYYHSLTDTTLLDNDPNIGEWRCFIEKEKVYFCSNSDIVVFDLEDHSLKNIPLPEDFCSSFFVNNRLYSVGYDIHGLMVYKDSAFQPVAGGSHFKELNISGMESFGDKRLLISTFYNGMMILDLNSGRIQEDFLEPKLGKELEEAWITFMSIEDDNILVGTYFNGLYILDMDGRVRQILSRSEELRDKTITSVYSSHQLEGGGPLWIAHWKGISKVETNNPFKKFTEAAGFEGLITDIAEFRGRMYISTMSGLYYRNSTEEGTRFVPVDEVQGEIYDLQVIHPTRRSSYMLVASNLETFLVNSRGYVEVVSNRLYSNEEDENKLPTVDGMTIVVDPRNPSRFFTGANSVIGLEYYRGRWKLVYLLEDMEEEIESMAMDRFGYLWIGSASNIRRLDVSLSQEATLVEYGQNDGLPSDAGNMVFSLPDEQEVKVGTREGFYCFDYFKERFYPDSALNALLPPGKNRVQTIFMDKDGDYWLSIDNEFRGWTEFLLKKKGDVYEIISERPFQRLSSAALVDVFENDPEEGIWFSKSDELYHYDKKFFRNDSLFFNSLIRKVTVNGDSLLFNGCNFTIDPFGEYHIHGIQEDGNIPVLDHRYNNIEFSWAAPYFEQEERLLYSYKLENFNREWSDWSRTSSKPFTRLKHGRYTLHVKARNVYDYESEPASYAFVIRRPWYASIPAILGYILLGGLFIFLVIKLYTRRLTMENIRLEGIIQERTAEIRKQKEELTDSIEYASRIQRALLPSVQLMLKHQLEHFILFRPRDIVSGDFYWLGEKKGKLMLVAADCTGHGVPGAFMSMLGMTFLDEIVINTGIVDTAKILDSLREHVISSLEQSHVESHDAVKDGMDLAMLSIDLKTGAVQFSGAYNPLYLVRKLKTEEKEKIDRGEELDIPRGSIYDEEYLLLQLRADQMPIGISEKENKFTSTRIKDEGYSYYMFSDGYVDQFGGSKGKKFMSRNFKKLLLELQKHPIEEQGAALEKVLLDWMGDISQIDDILVMGLRLQSN